MKHLLLTTIAAGADVNGTDRRGWTPLHYAAYGGSKEIAELLIGKGADVNTKDAAGMTPLDFAIIYDHPETADPLRKYEARGKEELKPQKK